MPNDRRKVKIALIGGRCQSWAHTIIRDITFKKGMDNAFLELRFSILICQGQRPSRTSSRMSSRNEVDWAKTYATKDSNKALKTPIS